MNKWILYLNSKIIPEMNYKVDSIETYLSSLTKLEITGTTEKEAPMYIKHSLAQIIKLNMSQSMLDFFTLSNNLNYMSIKNDEDTYPVYYFIIKKTWISKNTIALNLKMDTVNTFTVDRGNMVISNRTLVNREHKDRFEKIGEGRKHFVVESTVRGVEYFFDYLSLQTEPSEITSLPRTFNLIRRNRMTNEIIQQIVIDTIKIFDDFHIVAYSENIPVYEIYAEEYEQSNEVLSFIYTRSVSFVNEENFLIALGGTYDEIRYRRIIDLYSEGLTPVLFGSEFGTGGDITTEDNLDWFLVYKNQNEPTESLTNPVNCFICASEDLILQSALLNRTFNNNELSIFSSLYCYVRENVNLIFEFKRTAGDTWHNINLTSQELVIRFYYKSTTNDISVEVYRYNSADEYISTRTEEGLYQIRLTNANVVREGFVTTSIETILNYDIPTDLFPNDILKSITNDFDRTDAKLIKIIKLPYAPLNFTISNGVIKYDTTLLVYDGTEHRLKLIDLNTKFENDIPYNENPLQVFNVNLSGATTSVLKNDFYESKLFHSDYYQPKFVYDSFGFTFQLERISDREQDSNFIINFIMTSTINSRFLFEFPQYVCDDLFKEDYYNILPIARNNEITIYNQQYMNYLRAGYNYDVKSKQRQETATIVGTAVSAVGAIVSFVAGGPIGAAAGIGLATSAIAGLVSTVNSIAQAEQNIAQKQEQLRNQATSVSGADDVDLMSYYSHNRAKLLLYTVSPKMRKSLFDLFYFTGYISGVQKVPDFTSRTWFNFVSCDLVLNEVRNIPEDCLADLKDCYKNGITVMHRVNGTYDWNREKENWETSLDIGG